MSGPESLEQILEDARRERPAVLPRGFSAEVMERISRQAAERPRPSPGALDYAVIGMAAVIVAGLVSLLVVPSNDSSGPPRLAVFGTEGNSSPFATP